MKIKTAVILCAGLGKRLNPLTQKIPKPLLKLNDVTMLENCINLTIKLGITKILLNTFHLSDQISNFVKNKNFPIEIQIIRDGKKILNTGGGILNMINKSKDKDYLIFNPDTLWNEDYLEEIGFISLNESDIKLDGIYIDIYGKQYTSPPKGLSIMNGKKYYRLLLVRYSINKRPIGFNSNYNFYVL